MCISGELDVTDRGNSPGTDKLALSLFSVSISFQTSAISRHYTIRSADTQ